MTHDRLQGGARHTLSMLITFFLLSLSLKHDDDTRVGAGATPFLGSKVWECCVWGGGAGVGGSGQARVKAQIQPKPKSATLS